MGRYRFKLSDMIPNAWFYKLRDLGSRKKPTAAKNSSSITSTARTAQPAAVPPSPAKQAIHPRRASYYIPRPGDRSPDFPSFHPKAVDTKLSARKKARKPRRPPTKLVRSSISSGCSCRSSSLGAMWKAEPMPAVGGGYSTLPDPDGAPSGSSSSRSSGLSSSPPECSTTIDLSSKSSADVTPAHVDLPPILTRPASGDGGGDDAVTPSWRGRRRRVQYGRVGKVATPRPSAAGGLSGSLAVVKSSSDPRRDFRESMVEMIVENRLKTAKDLEDLLACYLSLNSAEYHDVIVQVFEQIWLDLSAGSGP